MKKKATPRENGWKYFAINLTDKELKDINYKLDCIRLMYEKVGHPLHISKIKNTNKNKLHNKQIIKHLIDSEFQIFQHISEEVLNEENNTDDDNIVIDNRLLSKTCH